LSPFTVNEHFKGDRSSSVEWLQKITVLLPENVANFRPLRPRSSLKEDKNNIIIVTEYDYFVYINRTSGAFFSHKNLQVIGITQ